MVDTLTTEMKWSGLLKNVANKINSERNSKSEQTHSKLRGWLLIWKKKLHKKKNSGMVSNELIKKQNKTKISPQTKNQTNQPTKQTNKTTKQQKTLPTCQSTFQKRKECFWVHFLIVILAWKAHSTRKPHTGIYCKHSLKPLSKYQSTKSVTTRNAVSTGLI